MRRLLVGFVLIAGAGCIAYASMYSGLFRSSDAVAAVSPHSSITQIRATEDTEARRLLREQAICFVPNLGQWSLDAKYIAQFRAMTVFLGLNGWTLKLRETRPDTGDASRPFADVDVSMNLVGSEADRIEPQWRVPGLHHYLIGEVENWRRDVPLYGALRYRQVQPGVNIHLSEDSGRLKFGLELDPSASTELIEIDVQGIDQMRIDGSGGLVLETPLGALRIPAPRGWEEGPAGERSPVVCDYVIHRAHRFGVKALTRKPGWSLLVESKLKWSTGPRFTNSVDRSYDLVTEPQGETLITGESDSPFLASDSGRLLAGQASGGDPREDVGTKVFVMRLSSESRLRWKTYLGGEGAERSFSVAVGAEGSATIGGATDSSGFPTTAGAFDRVYHGGGDAFVARLSHSGRELVYSTYLGGTGSDHVSSLTLDPLGLATVRGLTDSANFPAQAPVSPIKRRDESEFVVHLDMLPSGVKAYGGGSPGCRGPLMISVSSLPTLGSEDFVLSCSGAPPNTNGGIITGTKAVLPPSKPIRVLGAEMWVDPKGSTLIGGFVRSDKRGIAHFSLPIPMNPALRGFKLFAQFAWMGPTKPKPCPKTGLSATRALEITVR